MTRGILIQVDGVIEREVAGEYFLVPIRGNVADLQELFVMNEAGRWVWRHLDGQNRVEELAGMMVQEFEVTMEQAQQDITLFIEQLVEAGLAVESLPRAN